MDYSTLGKPSLSPLTCLLPFLPSWLPTKVWCKKNSKTHIFFTCFTLSRMLSVLLIDFFPLPPSTAHCANWYASAPSDPAPLVTAREQVSSYIGAFLDSCASGCNTNGVCSYSRKGNDVSAKCACLNGKIGDSCGILNYMELGEREAMTEGNILFTLPS